MSLNEISKILGSVCNILSLVSEPKHYLPMGLTSDEIALTDLTTGFKDPVEFSKELCGLFEAVLSINIKPIDNFTAGSSQSTHTLPLQPNILKRKAEMSLCSPFGGSADISNKLLSDDLNNGIWNIIGQNTLIPQNANTTAINKRKDPIRKIYTRKVKCYNTQKSKKTNPTPRKLKSLELNSRNRVLSPNTHPQISVKQPQSRINHLATVTYTGLTGSKPNKRFSPQVLTHLRRFATKISTKPSKSQVTELSIFLGLSRKQVRDWFSNIRRPTRRHIIKKWQR